MHKLFASASRLLSGFIRFMRSFFKRFASARKVPGKKTSIVSAMHSAALARATSCSVTRSIPRRRDGAVIVAFYPHDPAGTLRRAAEQKRLTPYYRFKLYRGESYAEVVSYRELNKLFSKR